MNIQGLNKVTLLDYPGYVACTVFTGGCDLRCPFCHNSQLVLHPAYSTVETEEVFAFLNRRRGTLDGVAVTGGEPLLQPDIADFLARVRDMGFRIKLDTNGTHPDRLADIISRGLCDYVAMDIKNSPAGYPRTVGIPDFDISPVRESVALLLGGDADYEFRTTAVREFHTAESFGELGLFIRGARKYFIQNFVDSGALIAPGLHGFDENEMKGFASVVSPFVKSVTLRGV